MCVFFNRLYFLQSTRVNSHGIYPATNLYPRTKPMKTLAVIALLSMSFSSFAGRMIKAGGSCRSTVDPSISFEAQRIETIKCAERDARSALSRQCSHGDYYIANDNIAQRNTRTFGNQYGRTITATATAVGTCERFNQF